MPGCSRGFHPPHHLLHHLLLLLRTRRTTITCFCAPTQRGADVFVAMHGGDAMNGMHMQAQSRPDLPLGPPTSAPFPPFLKLDRRMLAAPPQPGRTAIELLSYEFREARWDWRNQHRDMLVPVHRFRRIVLPPPNATPSSAGRWSSSETMDGGRAEGQYHFEGRGVAARKGLQPGHA